MQRRLDRDHAAVVPPTLALQAGGDHAGVVEHQGVAGAQQLRQVAKPPALHRAIGLDHEQSRCVPRGGRSQGDPLFREVEVEVGEAHASAFRLSPRAGEAVRRTRAPNRG